MPKVSGSEKEVKANITSSSFESRRFHCFSTTPNGNNIVIHDKVKQLSVTVDLFGFIWNSTNLWGRLTSYSILFIALNWNLYL